jgi:hypothetical protein
MYVKKTGVVDTVVLALKGLKTGDGHGNGGRSW